MKWRYFLICTCLLFFALPNFAQTPPSDMKLFLLIGQSNMAGRGIVEPQDEATSPHIFMLKKDLQWTLAKDPVHFDKPVAGVGLASEFARTLAQADFDMSIGLIPCAVGGTSLDQWKAGGELYTNAILRTKEALKNGQLAGILWHQGEADNNPEKTKTYVERFQTMIAQLRKDLDAENVPVIIGELGHFKANANSFNVMLPSIPANVPLCALVTAEDLTDKGDKLHFDAKSLRVFGQRYAEAFLSFESKEKTATKTP